MAWKTPDITPIEDQKVTVVFLWDDRPQLAAGTYQEGKFYQDAGDMRYEIHDVAFWDGHEPPPGFEDFGSPWISD